ncbi:MAG: hypothetical protein E7L01_06885 [Paenibacillus macerans]|uniref:DUF7689 domain-containing protein n=1 Tax=Paenibacillus TaxID=44249 RepID=UPI001B229EDA|nr:hypothetical protein [Paenibacillus macerans]MBS5912951.1 hypothetical protein [Paenibacillus macerans]MDU7473067.1 hypothetical protein [Paenibacillus macerans]MEC0140627.1 hypothetical protein [Paenibacillus macerans]GIP08720.1 hypothetical protein J1TS5_08900 [Paenibacillus macerans]
MKKIIQKMLVISMFITSALAGGTSAYALYYSKEFYDAIAYNYTEIGPVSTTYNCLSYALGYTDRWLWPWGETATTSQVDSFLKLYGYKGNTFGYVYATPGIIAYGPSTNNINHFAKATQAYVAKSKWGSLELMQTTWDPYKPNGGYGPALRYYN